jgi:type IV pilus assembly protein PilO
MQLNIATAYEWPLPSKLALLGVVFAVAFYIGYWWDLSSINANVRTLSQQEEDLKTQLESLVAMQKNLQQELTTLPSLQTSLKVWQQRIVKHNQIPELLNTILKTGASNHLYFTLFNPEEEVIVKPYRKLPIKMIVVGSYHQIGDFFSQMANLPWLVEISNFILTNENRDDVLGTKLAQQANAENLLTAEVHLQIYHYPDPSELIIIPAKSAPNKATTGPTPNATTPAPAP